MDEWVYRVIDFSQCKYCEEVYDLLGKELELPSWWGRNLDALWDCVWGIMATPADITLCGVSALPKDLQPLGGKITALLKEAEAKYGEIKVHVIDMRKLV